MIYPTFIDHLVFRVANLNRTERFYTALLGQPAYKAEDTLMYLVAATRIFFTCSAGPVQEAHEKENIGLNHFAFGVASLQELQTIQTQLDDSGVSHSGIKLDSYGLKEFIWLDDPDEMRVEFYLRS
jgi:glyoxylase I family protein